MGKTRDALIFFIAIVVLIIAIQIDLYDYYRGSRKSFRGLVLNKNHDFEEDFLFPHLQDLPRFNTQIKEMEQLALISDIHDLQISKIYAVEIKSHDSMSSPHETNVTYHDARDHIAHNDPHQNYSYPANQNSPQYDTNDSKHDASDNYFCSSCDSGCNCCDPCCDYCGCASDRYYFTLRRNEGRTVGDNSSYTTIGITSFPFSCTNILPFVDVRGHYFDWCSRYGANVGVGVRFLPDCCCDFGLFPNQIFGINAYYSYRDYRHHAHFNQLGLGFEMLGECISFRLNGYFPIGSTHDVISRCIFNEFIGDFFMIQENFADALQGVDFEIESYIGCLCCWDFYAALGSYYYQGGFCNQDIYGTEYRLTGNYCDAYRLSLLATSDCCYKTRIQAEFEIFLPYNGCCCDWLWYQPVRRRDPIVIGKHSEFISNF